MFRISVLSSGAYQDFRSVVGPPFVKAVFWWVLFNLKQGKKRVMRFIFRLLSFVCDPESSCAVSIWFSFWCKERGKNFFDWVLSSSDCKLSCWKNNTFVSKNSVYNLTFFSENRRSTFSWCQVATLGVRKSIFFPLRMYLKTSI